MPLSTTRTRSTVTGFPWVILVSSCQSLAIFHQP
jgi:hypothetical protein